MCMMIEFQRDHCLVGCHKLDHQVGLEKGGETSLKLISKTWNWMIGMKLLQGQELNGVEKE